LQAALELKLRRRFLHLKAGGFQLET